MSTDVSMSIYDTLYRTIEMCEVEALLTFMDVARPEDRPVCSALKGDRRRFSKKRESRGRENGNRADSVLTGERRRRAVQSRSSTSSRAEAQRSERKKNRSIARKRENGVADHLPACDRAALASSLRGATLREGSRGVSAEKGAIAFVNEIARSFVLTGRRRNPRPF